VRAVATDIATPLILIFRPQMTLFLPGLLS
jgi:hypothetical protein